MAAFFRLTAAVFFIAVTYAMFHVTRALAGWLPWSAPLLLLLAVAWLATAAATFDALVDRRLGRILVRGIISILITLVTIELVLWAVGTREAVSYYVWRPNITQLFRPPPAAFPGVADQALFSSSAEGLRGPDLPRDARMRVLAVGGSTTESMYIDDMETWPQVVQTELSGRGVTAWVGNAGKSGTSSHEHIVMLNTLAPEIRPDVILMLVGVNDLLRPHSGEGRPPFGQDGMLQYEYTRAKRDAGPGPERLALYWQVRRLVQFAERSIRLTRGTNDQVGPSLLRARERRNRAVLVDDLPPDLDPLIAAYERRLRELTRLGRALDSHVVFMTQPSLYLGEIGAEERRVLTVGHYALPGEGREVHDPALGPERYFSERAMGELLRRYNAATLRVCEIERLQCLDLAAAIPPRVSHMFDDFHFNRDGSRAVGSAVADFLLRAKLAGN